MKLAYHGGTHVKSDLATDIAASAQAGFGALELWAAKIDRYLDENPLSQLEKLLRQHGVEPASINSIEFIGFRGDEYAAIRQRCEQLCKIARESDVR